MKRFSFFRSLYYLRETNVFDEMKKPILCLILLAVVQCLMAQNWDINTVHHINSWHGSFIHNYSSFISTTEPYIALGLPFTMMGVGWWKHDEALMKDALYVGVAVVGSFALCYGTKYIVDRPRPFNAYPDLIHARSIESSPSFPSGHTASAFALATSLCIKYPKWYVIAPSALWVTSVGLSRMHEGVHYPTDVMAGAALGVGCAIGSIYVSRWLNKLFFDK